MRNLQQTSQRRTRRNIALTLCVIQIVLAFVLPAAASVQIESILGTGPALSVVGLMLAIAARPLGSRAVTLFALSAPLVSELGASLIAWFDWGPRQAHYPIVFISTFYAVLVLPLAALTLRLLWIWPPNESQSQPLVWQYSLRSMLWTTTALCILLVLTKLAVTYERISASIGFGIFAIVTIVLITAVSIVSMRANRSKPTQNTCDSALKTPGRAEGDLANN